MHPKTQSCPLRLRFLRGCQLQNGPATVFHLGTRQHISPTSPRTNASHGSQGSSLGLSCTGTGLYPQADVLRDCQQMLLVPYQADSSSKGIWHPGESCRHWEDTVQDGHSSQGLLSPLTSTGPALEVFPMAILFLTCPQLSQRVKSHIQATYLSCSLPLITSVLLSMFSLPHLATLAPWK